MNKDIAPSPVPSPDATLVATYADDLLKVMAYTVWHNLAHGAAATVKAEDYPEALRPPRATFVTLEQAGALRGCIGSMTPHRPLVEDVAANAHAAAYHDPRFEPLTPAGWLALTGFLSLLSPMEPITCDGELTLLASLRPGLDGLCITAEGRRGVFLPQVWKVLSTPSQFFDALREKAGLPPHYWSPELKIERFTVTSTPAQRLASRL